MKNLVSIIIPVYNVADFIIPCLSSVAEQSYYHIEVIIVDDCGTDNSMQLVEQFISNYKGSIKFRILKHSRNAGLSAARNTGTAHAAGQYIYYLDSDDMLTPDTIKNLLEKAEETDADMICGEYCFVGGEDIFDGHMNLKSDEVIIQGTQNILEALCRRQYFVTAWNKLIKTDFLKKSGVSFIEGLLFEDDPWSVELAYKLNKIVLLNKKTYQYVYRKTSILNELNLKKKLTSIEKLVRINFELASQHPEFKNNKYLYECCVNKLLNYIQFAYENFDDDVLFNCLQSIETFQYDSKYFSVFAKGLHGSHRMLMMMYHLPKWFRPFFYKLMKINK